ncbi:PstS family phosphate ABC transporter substrate-binding protein [Bacteroidota bacterium]
MKTSPFYTDKMIVLFSILIVLFLSNCEKSLIRSPCEVSLDNFTLDNYPKVDGSTSAHPLQVLIACKVLGVEYSWIEHPFDETYRLWPSSEDKPDIAQFIYDSITHNGTHSAYMNLIDGKSDMVIVARVASEDEIHYADSMGVELTATPIALDAFVFIVDIKNPVNSLTVKQVQDIYTGDITYWNQVGGTYTEINPYVRNPNSGSQELMLSLVMKDLEMKEFHEMMMLLSMMGPINRITEDKYGIGYTVYFFEQFMAPNDNLKLLAIDGVFPEYKTIKNRSYIYSTEVFAVIREDLDRQSTAYQLFQWLITTEGRCVIEESGYIVN